MIYFIKAEYSGSIKIGKAANPNQRLAQLATGTPEPLSLLGVIDGSYERERELHDTFSRFRLRGEWFRPDPEFVDAVNKILRPKYPVIRGKPIKSAYLAGKITDTIWRDEIVPNWSKDCGGGDSWDDHRARSVPVSGGYTVSISGPFWTDCTGGQAWASEYGFPHASVLVEKGKSDWLGRQSNDHLGHGNFKIISSDVMSAIDRSDLVFAWIDSTDCFGTLFEIGYAVAKKKVVAVYVAFFLDVTELWMSCIAADVVDKHGQPGWAWSHLFSGKFTARANDN